MVSRVSIKTPVALSLLYNVCCQVQFIDKLSNAKTTFGYFDGREVRLVGYSSRSIEVISGFTFCNVVSSHGSEWIRRE